MRRMMICSLLIGGALAASLAAIPARAEVTDSSATGFTVTTSVEVAASRYEAWAVLTAPAKWWSAEHTRSGNADNLYLDSQATGCFCELLPPDPGAPAGTRRGSVEHLHIIYSQPGKLLRMTGGLGPLQSQPVRGLFTVTLAAAGTGTRITIDYIVDGVPGGAGGKLAPAVDQVLAEQLGRLAAVLNASTPVAEPSSPDQPKG